jgi:transposase
MRIKPTHLIPHTGRHPNEERREMVKRLYLAGLSIRDVADKVGVTFQAVQAMLDRMDVPRRPRGGNTGGHSRHKR